VPGEPRSPFVTSGLRLGTPAVTTRGFGREDCVELANIIADVLDNMGDASAESAAREAAVRLCRKYPVYGHLR
jgi:glycine hydroxymethyltransferase